MFELMDGAICRPVDLRPSRGYWYPMLERPTKGANAVRLWPEWLTHAAIVASLHLDYGYALSDIALEVDDALDALVWSPLNQPYIAVEVKKTAKELEAMIAELHALSGKPFELRPGLTNAARKFRALLALRPRYFFAAAPGVDRAFALSIPNLQTVELHEISELPSA